MTLDPAIPVPDAKEAFCGRLLESVRGTFEIFSIYLGVRLGYYDALAAGEPLTSSELAQRTDTHERYAREWLEQQTVNGLLAVEDEKAAPRERRFTLDRARAEVLADPESLDFMAPIARLAVGALHPLEELLEAYRTGGGVSYADYGVDLLEGQGAINRTAFLQLLGREWLPAMPDVDARLQADPPARIADVGCGVGWSSIAMARAYPRAIVDGYDLDAASIEKARLHAVEAGLADRVRFHLRDAGDPALAGRYDLVTALECVHDMAQPIEALRTMRQLAGDVGAVLIADERVGEQFTREGNDIEWMMYGWSIFHCLPAGMAEQPSAGTGCVMRPDTLRRYAEAAGFRDLEVVPIENFFFRFYRLRG